MLAFSAAAAVRPSPWEAEYRKAVNASLHEGPEAALRIVEHALTRAGIASEDWLYALRIYRAELQAQINPGGALAVLRAPLPPHLGKTEIEIRRLTGLAVATYFTNDAAEAEKIADKMVVLASKHVPAFVADAYYLRGNLRQNEDDVRRAARLFKAAGNDTWALMSEALLIRALERQERCSEAVEIGDRVVPRLLQARLSTAGSMTGNLASSYFCLGDYESAEEYFRLAEKSARRLKKTHDLIVWLDRLGDVYLATGDLDGAARSYAEAAAVARTYKHRQLARVLSNLAQVAIRRGQFDEARRSIEESIRLDTAVKELEDVRRARVIRASLNMATGNYAAAKRELEDVIATTATTLWRLQAQTGLGRLHAAQKQNELAERYYARALKTAVKARASIQPDHRFSYFNSVEDLLDSYVDFLVANKQAGKALAITEESRARTLAEGLGTIASKQKRDPSAIAKQANATILSYWLGARRSYVWKVTATGVSIHQLPPAAEIERDVDRYRKMLEHGSLGESAAQGQKLFQTLVAPAVRGLPPGSRVIIIADDKLHSLNFETLVVPSPRLHWWIEDVLVTSANSLHLLGRPAPKRAGAADPMLLLVGNTPGADPAFAPLPNAGLEMQKVGAHFLRMKVLSGAAATPQAFLSAAPAKFDVIHFVAHGIASRRHPLDSAVILAKDKAGTYRLFARDIVDQRLTARLVTISSCHGAGTRAYAGEGLVGLAWAFLRAGAGEVIAALWEVDDAATTKLMDHMYARIRRGQDPAVALRDAKLTLIRSKTSHQKPRYWAPFVIYAGS